MSADSADTGEEETLFDRATAAAQEHSSELGDSDGIDVMTFSGPIGFHAVVAQGAPVNFQAELATLLAIREQLQMQLHVPDDVDSPEAAAPHIQDGLEGVGFDPFAAESIGEKAVEKLSGWQDYHSAGGDGQ